MAAAGILGHVAGGFEQARQQDLTRQFSDEQNRRAQLGSFLQKVAMDETAHPFSRQAAGNEYLKMSQTPWNKPYKFDPNTLVAPAQPGRSFTSPGTSGPPTPPPGMLNAGVTATPGPMMAQAPGQGAAGPPQQVPGAPVLSMPPPPPPASIFQGAGGGTVNLAPQPAQGIYMSPEEVSSISAQRAGAVAGGTMSGQIAARQQALSQVPGLPPELQAGLMLGTPGLYGAMNRTAGAGAGYAKDLRAQGYPVPDTINDNQYVTVKELVGGKQTFVPAPAPGEKAGGGGTLINQTEQTQRNTNIRYGTWQKENATQFGQRQSLLNQAFTLGVQRGVYGDANKALVDSVKDYGTAAKTMDSMDEAYKAVQANPNNQQAQVALLMSHIGMTLGVVKGARVGKAQIEDAENSRNMFAGAASKLNFDKDGNLDWSDPIRKGITLTPDQMKQMVDLGHQRMNILHQNIGRMHDELDPNTMGTQYITPTPMGAGGTRKAGGGGPPKPPAGMGAGTIQMKAPNGMTKAVPADQVDHYKSLGATVIQ